MPEESHLPPVGKKYATTGSGRLQAGEKQLYTNLHKFARTADFDQESFGSKIPVRKIFARIPQIYTKPAKLHVWSSGRFAMP